MPSSTLNQPMPKAIFSGDRLAQHFCSTFPRLQRRPKIFAISAFGDRTTRPARIRHHPLILPRRRQRHPQQSPATARLLLPHTHALRLGLNF